MAQLVYSFTDLSPFRSLTGVSLANQYVADYIADMADPHYVAKKQRRSERFYETEYGSTFWYDRRDPSQSELPDLGAAIGED